MQSTTTAPAAGSRRRAILAALAAMACLLGLTLPPAYGTATAAAPLADKDATVAVSVTSITPTVLRPGQPLTISGRLTNIGREAVREPVVRLAMSPSPLSTRTRVHQWLDGSRTVSMGNLGTTSLGAPLSPRASGTFTMTVPPARLPTPTTGRTSLPTTLTVTDGPAGGRGSVRGELRTAVPWLGAGATVPNPVPISVVVPLTLPADPALFSSYDAERLAAWRRAIGPGSPIDQLLTSLRGRSVTWLVDPTMLEPPMAPDPELPPAGSGAEGEPDTVPTPTSTPSPTGSASPSSPTSTPGTSTPAPTPDGSNSSQPAPSPTGPTPTTPSPSTPSPTTTPPTEPPINAGSVDSLVRSLRDRLTERGSSQPVWFLPYGDPDLVALQRSGGAPALSQHLSRPLSPATRAMSETTIQWPAADPTPAEAATITRTWRTTRAATPLSLFSSRQLTGQARAETTTVPRRLTDATPVLAYDELLSTTLGGASDPGARTQRFLADSLAAYLEAPSTPRSMLLVAPRTDTASGPEVAAVLDSIAGAPWLRGSTTQAVREQAGAAPPTSRIAADPDPPPNGPRPSPIGAQGLARIAADRRLLDDLGRILVSSSDVVSGWNAAYDELGSARWRGQARAHATTYDRLHENLQAVPRNVSVRPGSINFFTDAGQIGVTVVNELNRPVRDVQLLLSPRRFVLTVEEQPPPLRLQADSRVTVRVPLRAVAAGTVKVDAVLMTPAGITLGAPTDAPTQLEFNVRPTATWLYWVLGAFAGPVLVIGLIRSLRRGPRPETVLAAPDDPQPGSDDD